MEPSLAEVSVLIVDDSMIVRKAIRKAVRGAGVDNVNIREAGHGQEALDALDEHPSDVIFLDINMPVMDGEQFMETLEASGRSNDQYVVVVSTEVNAKRLMRMATMGARARLKKPFEPEKLRELIVDAARQKEKDGSQQGSESEPAAEPPPVDKAALATALSSALETMCFVIADPVDACQGEAMDHHATITIGDEEVRWSLNLSCSGGLLLEVACGLMGVEPEEIEPEEILPQTILELANVFSGEVITLLGGEDLPYRPGIPEGRKGSVPENAGAHELHFDAMGEQLSVWLVGA